MRKTLKALVFTVTTAGFIGHAWSIDCSRPAGSVPPNISVPIEHIVVIMQENHSFDNYFGHLNSPQFYGNAIDGVDSSYANTDRAGNTVHPYKEQNLCIADPIHSWAALHADWNGGLNDRFVYQNDGRVMGTYDQTDIPYYYALANQFAVADRYFASVMTSTFPNRFFLMTGTAFGHIKNDKPKGPSDFSQTTIYDLLDTHGVSWKYYTNDKGYVSLFGPLFGRSQAKLGTITDYENDLKGANFPQVAFIDAAFDGEDEHPAADIQRGQAWSADRINSLINSSYWKQSVLFLTYDENGGFYDHVAPPEACAPDNIGAVGVPNPSAYQFDRYGFRVPFVAISPYAKHHYVSHSVYDHTSILKFIETKFHLPALTARDANADGLMDLFDFNNPQFSTPTLPVATVDLSRKCP